MYIDIKITSTLVHVQMCYNVDYIVCHIYTVCQSNMHIHVHVCVCICIMLTCTNIYTSKKHFEKMQGI